MGGSSDRRNRIFGFQSDAGLSRHRRVNLRFGSPHSLGSNIKWGVEWGLWFACGFSLLGSVLYLVQGTFLGERSQFAFPLVVLAYFVMGLVGGLIAGLLRPLTRWRIGATGVGVVVGVVVYFIAGLTAVGRKEFLSLAGLVSTLVLGTVIGGYCGYSSWSSKEGRKQV